MAFSEHKAEFAGKPVVDYKQGTPLAPQTNSYRLRRDWEDTAAFSDLLTAFLAEPNVDQVTGLLTGAYSDEMYEGGESMDQVSEAIVAAADRLASLEGLFIGDITFEENEVSWIVNGDLSPVWGAFPRLRTFGTRGGGGLSLGAIAHDQLQALIVESGGLPQNVLQELAKSRLPELEHLELYLGTDEYGWGGTIDDVRALLTGDLFPKLKYLGLRNSQIADEVAVAVSESPLLDRIEVLDLSLGVLTDVGGRALLNSEGIESLKRIDLHHNYLSDDVRQQLIALPAEVDADPGDADESEWGGEIHRYVAIGE